MQTLFFEKRRRGHGILEADVSLEDGQDELALIRYIQLAVDAIRVGLDRPQGQVHGPGRCQELLAVKDVLDNLELTGGEAQFRTYSVPFPIAEHLPPALLGKRLSARARFSADRRTF